HTAHSPTTFSFFHTNAPHRPLHSFPTRRSSDLVGHEAQRLGGHALRTPHMFRSGAPDALDLQHAHVSQHHEQADQRLGAAQEERSEEHTSELQSRGHLVCRLLLEKKKNKKKRKS